MSKECKWEVYKTDPQGHSLFTGLIVSAASHDEAHKLAAHTLGQTLSDLKVCLIEEPTHPPLNEEDELTPYDIRKDFQAFEIERWEVNLNRMRDVGLGGVIMVRCELGWMGPAWKFLVERVFDQRKADVLGVFYNEDAGEGLVKLSSDEGLNPRGVKVLRAFLPDEHLQVFDLGVEIGLSCS